ncbi:MAG TPA: hypothetical protein VGO61_02965 [Steroidobacteraceae bacterium]|jgi:hypothetical protein|nr:hypothetical protein [Steroidobacteraceae bacterium]
MRVVLTALVAIAASAPLFAQSVPAVPDVTVGAGIKSFRFDWSPAARAARYELWQRSRASAAFQKAAEYPASSTHANFRVAVHSFDWSGARFRVAACNSSGCTNSRDIAVDGLRLQAPGYFKSSQPKIAETFGSDVDVSPNGVYLVAAAPNDDASGAAAAGAAYVFQRNSDTVSWAQRARLLPEIVQAEGGEGLRVAISADGNTVAMGLPNIFHAQSDPNSGEVYVFHNAGGTWQRTRIAATKRGSFGVWVSLDDAGQSLAVGRDSGADTYILANGSWALRRAIEDRTSPSDNCPNGELSGNGRLLVEQCYNGSPSTPSRSYLRIHSSYASARRDLDLQRPSGAANDEQRYGLAVDFTGDWIAAQNFNGRIEVDIFQRVSGWHQFSQKVTAGSWQANKRSLFGQGISLSSDASVLAVGDPLDVGQGTGVQRGALTAGGAATGAVYVFRRNGSLWPVQSVIKPNYLAGAGGSPAQTFGVALSLSETGTTLAVGQPLESSDAVGIDGAWNNARRSQSGAVWLY